MKVTVFGALGFIGSHFIDELIKRNSDCEIIIVDKVTYAANKDYAQSLSLKKNIKIIKSDLNDAQNYISDIEKSTFAINFAAESHVDNSILNPEKFVETNSLGVTKAIWACMKAKVSKFIQISTDEVYGSTNSGEFDELSILNPSSPYSSSKASGDLIALSFWKTFGYPISITRGCNTYGFRQFPEKLIPLAINKLKNREKIPLYGKGDQIREWIHVSDHAKAIIEVALNGGDGQIYNIGTMDRFTNLYVVNKIIKIMQTEPNDYIEFIEDRKGHDIRYAINSSKIRNELKWNNTISFDIGIYDLVQRSLK